MSPISAKIIEGGPRLLSIETCRQQCEVVPIDTDSDGVVSHPDDALLLAFQDAAVDYAERFTGRAIILRTYEFALDQFPRNVPSTTLQPAIEIPYPPLVEVLSFTYTDDSDGELDPGDHYTIDDYADKATVRPVSSWPASDASANRIKFRYRAGYLSEVDPDSDCLPLPGAIKAAILLMIDHLYENRAASAEKAMQELPLGVEALLRPYRVLLGMA